ncbi:MAG: sulfite exporter TauE/SafE family protein [Pseudomonadota bacterium]
MEIATLLSIIGLLLATGAFAGILAGLLGVGGGVVLVIAFLYAFRATGFAGPDVMQICLATSLATVIVTSLRSVAAHNRAGAVEWSILKAWAPFLSLGAALGVVLAVNLHSNALQMIFALLAAFLGIYMAFGRSSWRLGDRFPTGLGGRVSAAVVGLLSVLMGIGGGSFGVPLMTLFNVPVHRAVATAAGFGVAIAAPSVLAFLFVTIEAPAPPLTLGAVNLIALAVVVPVTALTTPWGAALAHRLPAMQLRRGFGVFLLLVSANMLREALGA